MSDLHATLSQGLNAFLVLSIPFAAVVSIGGIVIAALQAATSVREEASYYTGRLLLVLLVGYFMLATLISTVTMLAKACFGP